jgi:hypothetical protein
MEGLCIDARRHGDYRRRPTRHHTAFSLQLLRQWTQFTHCSNTPRIHWRQRTASLVSRTTYAAIPGSRLASMIQGLQCVPPSAVGHLPRLNRHGHNTSSLSESAEEQRTARESETRRMEGVGYRGVHQQDVWYTTSTTCDCLPTVRSLVLNIKERYVRFSFGEQQYLSSLLEMDW